MKYKILISIAALAAFVANPSYAAGNAEAGKAKAPVCLSCHGPDGNGSVNAVWPALAGQHEAYISKQLADFKGGARVEPLMIAQVANLSAQDMADLGAYFAAQKAPAGKADKAKVALGEQLFRGGNKTTGVAACMACHGPSGAGNPAAKYPALQGQNAPYTIKALKDFRSAARANDPGKMMQGVAVNMTDAEIEAVASYISGLH
ncbi:MAG: cytochrome c4 [Gammaproteobacteria bacterium]|nr:cytochrome c4 [Gammaproteobacteria bacterium]